MTTGSIINITIEKNKDQQQQQQDDFKALQKEIYNLFCTPPTAPTISVKSITQTAITIQWKNTLVMHNCSLFKIEVWRNGSKLSTQVPEGHTSFKLSGLDVAHEYQIYIVAKTSAGAIK